MIANSIQEQIKKLQGLLATVTVPRQRKMYEEILVDLEAQVKEEEEIESKSQGTVKSKAAVQEKSRSPNNTQANVDFEKIKLIEEQSIEKPVEPELRFQARGVLEGEISLVEKGLAIAIDGEQYPLGWTFISRNRDYRKLQEELSSGLVTSVRKRVSVYPQVKFIDQQCQYSFYLVSVQKEGKQGIFSELEPGEFYLSGVWQYVQFHPTPCLSVYRNVTDNFLQMVSKLSLEKARNYFKAIHIPVEGLDSKKAFKFNPQAEKNQQKKRKFHCLKATFSENKFVAIKDSISIHSQIPKYLTANRAAEFLKKASEKN